MPRVLQAAYFKDLGLASAVRALGGVAAGIYLPQYIHPVSAVPDLTSSCAGLAGAFGVRCLLLLAVRVRCVDAVTWC